MALRRVAIYGGTFDPVHNGHIEVARRVLQLFELDEVIFVPACVPPHKRNANITSAFHRFAMLALATETDQKLLLSTVELDAPELPYAVETVARMKNDLTRLFFIIGADSWAEISTWHEWQRLMEMCDLIVATRPGYTIYDNVAPGAKVTDVSDLDSKAISELLDAESNPRVFVTNAVMVDVSATRIRAAAKSNDFIALNTMVPSAVATYIQKYHLYKK
jgi:nicotinate-nucleotide adenylyltransferase